MNPPPSEALARLKAATKWMWAQGDYPAVARLLETAAIHLAELSRVGPGMSVLDVAAGNGNFALEAARRGARVTACDMTPRMLALGRARSKQAEMQVEWVEGDAEALPFGDQSFDLVASVFGAMFAPLPDVVAAELFRVCRRGGVVAMANYNREGFLAGMAGLFDRYSSRRLAVDMPSPFDWGDEEIVRSRLARHSSRIEVERGTITWNFSSVDEALEFWESTNAPTIALRMTVEAKSYAAFQRDARHLMQDLNSASGEGLELKSSYLSAVTWK